MKVSKIPLLVLLTFTATLGFAQLPHFDNVIIIFMENRTPDNLFGSTPASSLNCGIKDPFEAGVDIEDCGPYGTGTQWLSPLPLASSVDPPHLHAGWATQCHLKNGQCQMDETCKNFSGGYQQCFSYAPESDVDPYFQIAENYGFANYMFQTNEGPSYPAHQFIVSGTSAPTNLPPPSKYNWFDLDLATDPSTAGCANLTGVVPFTALIDNYGCSNDQGHSPCVDEGDPVTYCNSHRSDSHCVPTCFTHNSLISLWDSSPQHQGQNGWKYYLPPYVNGLTELYTGIWNAPLSVSDICNPNSNNTACQNQEYNNDMIFEAPGNMTPILGDIASCHLAPISWVVPDRLWSDHGGESNGSGPSFVASIVNAVGSNTTCGYDGKGYWNNDPSHSVAIFITWDDWGGWFDHVNPSTYPGVNRTFGSWGAYYTYGFRVPLLVVSPYTPPTRFPET